VRIKDYDTIALILKAGSLGEGLGITPPPTVLCPQS